MEHELVLVNPKTEVTYWRSAKVPTVAYGARDICLTMKSIACAGQEDEVYQRMKSFVDERVEAQANQIANSTEGLRIREKNGKRFPSVTSIITPDKPQIPNLEKYGIKGTYYHEVCNNILLGKKEGPVKPDIAPLKYDIDIKGFFEEHGSKFEKEFQLNVEVFNEKHIYSGEIDYLGFYDGKLTLGDFKTGTWKLEQISSYEQAVKNLKVEQLAIFDLKNCKVLTWDINDQEIVNAWERFIFLRGMFKQRFQL